MNRAFYKFNDKLYFWVLKPVAQGIRKSCAQAGTTIGSESLYQRICSGAHRKLRASMPTIKSGFNPSLSRFGVNTTLGVLGLFDPAKDWFQSQLPRSEEDFGQTLGCYKGPGFYLNLPFAGSTSLRDGIGSCSGYVYCAVHGGC